jgi:hypothetical protein
VDGPELAEHQNYGRILLAATTFGPRLRTLEGYISVNSAPIELKFEYETVLYTQNLWY